jgi:glycosyltransferase involved in cell wall biosynthesis
VDVEHIIIDGGSTDGTIDVIRSFEDQIAYWESAPDHGQSDAINKGLGRASGTYFNWLNADDELVDGALRLVQRSAMKKANVVVGKCRHVNDEGRTITVGSARIWDSLEATLANYSMGQPAVFYKTEMVKELGGLNRSLHLCMDMDLWFRFLLKNGIEQIEVIDDVLANFYLREGSKSVDQETEMTAEKYGVYRALLSAFPLPPILESFFKDFRVPASVSYDQKDLNPEILFSNFAWHLMIKAYESSQLNIAKDYFQLVQVGNRMSETEKLLWKARLAKSNLFEL